MKYFKYYSPITKEVSIIEVTLKPKAKMTEEEWFNKMICGTIIAQADTIEELCDWIVAISKESKHIDTLYKNFDIAVNVLGNHCLMFDFFGAIETNKGLIYVAKMNERGELELL